MRAGRRIRRSRCDAGGLGRNRRGIVARPRGDVRATRSLGVRREGDLDEFEADLGAVRASEAVEGEPGVSASYLDWLVITGMNQDGVVDTQDV